MSNGDAETDVVSAGDRAVNADPALGYGQEAVSQGKTAAKPPVKKAKAKSYLDLANEARDKLAKSFPEAEKVVIHEWKKVPNPYVRMNRPGWVAWTNSGTDIYVTRQILNPAHAESALYHELLHVKQFLKDNRVPLSYTEMVEFEHQAYGVTKKYLDAKVAAGGLYKGTYEAWRDGASAAVTAITKMMQKHAKLSGDDLELNYARDLVSLEFLPLEVIDKGGNIAIPAPAVRALGALFGANRHDRRDRTHRADRRDWSGSAGVYPRGPRRLLSVRGTGRP